jgi:hypothetical protein
MAVDEVEITRPEAPSSSESDGMATEAREAETAVSVRQSSPTHVVHATAPSVLAKEVTVVADAAVKFAAAWVGLCTALTQAAHQSSPTATPVSDPSLSEASSSHGGLSPRAADASEHSSDVRSQAVLPVRWADEPEAETEFFPCGLATQDLCEHDECADPQGSDPITPSKRSRRSNRRRRNRADKTDAGGAAESHRTDHSTQGTRSGLRNSVTVGDLLGVSAGLNQASLVRSPPPKNGRPSLDLMGNDETAWFVPASPCHVQSGPKGIMSTSPYGGRAHLGPLAFAAEQEASSRAPSGYVPGMRSPASAHMPQPYDYGVRYPSPGLPDGAMWVGTGQTSPCMARAGPSVIVSTSPTVGAQAQAGEASSRRPPQQLFEVRSPCQSHAVASGAIITTSLTSTSPVSNSAAGNTLTWANAHSTSAEARAVDPAGSPTADALRSWLQASGLPPCTDLAWQLKASEPETYED